MKTQNMNINAVAESPVRSKLVTVSITNGANQNPKIPAIIPKRAKFTKRRLTLASFDNGASDFSALYSAIERLIS